MMFPILKPIDSLPSDSQASFDAIMNLGPMNPPAPAVQEGLKPPQTVTIFDWDDTLFVTSSLLPFNEAGLIPQFQTRHKQTLSWLDDAVVYLLLQA